MALILIIHVCIKNIIPLEINLYWSNYVPHAANLSDDNCHGILNRLSRIDLATLAGWAFFCTRIMHFRYQYEAYIVDGRGLHFNLFFFLVNCHAHGTSQWKMDIKGIKALGGAAILNESGENMHMMNLPWNYISLLIWISANVRILCVCMCVCVCVCVCYWWSLVTLHGCMNWS